MQPQHDELKQLFQQEFAKMVAVISKLFGLQHIEAAEDIVSDTFLHAMQQWAAKGMPANPTAWLYLVAKQKTIQQYRRNKVFDRKIAPALAARHDGAEELDDVDFSSANIKNSQLQMMFAVCNPAIAAEAQIGLALRVLCGFGIDEIAGAFLTNKETINKRLYRAKEKLRAEKIKMELPPEGEVDARLNNVLHVIYLLFSEGYYSSTQNQVFRQELCLDAVRLCKMLTEYARTNRPQTNALMALMCFHASRFNARQGAGDSLILYEEQDASLWDEALIQQGVAYLGLSAKGDEVTSYHIEARIAYWHCIKEDTPQKWQEILHLYNLLLFINYSPGVALNRTFALYKANGYQAALIEAEKLKLEGNHFYFILLGELYSHTDVAKARQHFSKALALAKTQTEKQAILTKLGALE